MATATFNGASATDTAVEYDANGARRVKENYTAVVGAGGVTTITGTGRCTGGTGVHAHETCSYTLTGTIDPKTNLSTSKEVGTIIR